MMVEPENVLAPIFVLLGDILRLVGESFVESLVKGLRSYNQPKVIVKVQIILHFLSHVACETVVHVALLCPGCLCL